MKKLAFVIFMLLVLVTSVVAVSSDSLSVEVVDVTPGSTVPGNEFTFNVNVSNFDTEALAGIQVSSTEATGPGGITLPLGLSHSVGDLDIGESTEFELSFAVPFVDQGVYAATMNVADDDGSHTDSHDFQFTVQSPLTLKLNNQIIDTSLEVDLESGERDNELRLTITNNANLVLSNVRVYSQFDALELEDDDHDNILISNPSAIPVFAIGDTRNLDFNFDVDNGFDNERKNGEILIEVDGEVFRRIPFTLDVKPVACHPSADDGDLNIDVREPDDGDDFEPGEEMEIELEIDNNGDDDMDVEVEAVLYNNDRNRVEDRETMTKDINDGDEETFEFTIQLDDNKDEDEFTLYLKVFDEDNPEESCTLEEVDVDVEVPDHLVTINNPTMSPLSATCGQRVSGSALLLNMGDNDEDVTFEVTNTQLGVSLTRTMEIEEDEDENDQLVAFEFTVPAGANEGSYPIIMKARYGGRSTQNSVTLNVVNCAPQNIEIPTTTANTYDTTGTSFDDVTGKVTYDDKSLFDDINKSGFSIPTSVWVLVNILLVILIILAVVWIFRSGRN